MGVVGVELSAHRPSTSGEDNAKVCGEKKNTKGGRQEINEKNPVENGFCGVFNHDWGGEYL